MADICQNGVIKTEEYSCFCWFDVFFWGLKVFNCDIMFCKIALSLGKSFNIVFNEASGYSFQCIALANAILCSVTHLMLII